MSATNKNATSHAVEEDSITTRIETYLANTIADGHQYLKSREIGDELGLSAKEVAVRLPKVDDRPNNITIEKWGYTSATTWLVKPTTD